jgi:hypothetical protein
MEPLRVWRRRRVCLMGRSMGPQQGMKGLLEEEEEEGSNSSNSNDDDDTNNNKSNTQKKCKSKVHANEVRTENKERERESRCQVVCGVCGVVCGIQ